MDIWPQIVATLATLGGTLGGVALAQWHQRKLATEHRAEERRIHLRTHAVSFLVAADRWAQQQQIWLPILLAAFRAKRSDGWLVELGDSPAADRILEVEHAVTESLSVLVLSTGDHELRSAVLTFQELWTERESTVVGLMTGDEPDVPAALQGVKRINAAAAEIRQQVLPLVQVPIAQPRKWQRGRVRREKAHP